MKKTYYVASWNTKEGEGITRFVYDKDTDTLYAKELENQQHRTSYFARNIDYLYVLTEGLISEPNTSNVTSYRMSSEGLEFISIADGLDSACPHIIVSDDKKHLYVSGYYSGALVALDIDKNGLISNSRKTYTNKGSSIHKRQESSHLHFSITTPDKKYICVCDLGTDEVLSFKIDKKTGDLYKVSAVKTPAGYGPRHMVFSNDGKYAYVICELTYHILVFAYKGRGKLEYINDIDLWPGCPDDKRACSAIKLSNDGKTLFTGNRGEGYSAIEAFELDDPEKPRKVASFTDVNFPRDITLLDDGYIAICNQHGNNIQFIRYHDHSFTQTGIINDIAEPVCVIEY